jgi:anthranilate phosphoribosyltransferase
LTDVATPPVPVAGPGPERRPDGERFAGLGGWPGVLGRLFARGDLTGQDAAAAFEEILAGRASPVQTAAFAAALRTKGETVDELTGFVTAMRSYGETVLVPADAIDTCGTGGDRSGTINVSTLAALVAVGAGATVCKHGGRAASSKAGSADVLEALGVVVDLGPEGVQRCLAEARIGFCLAVRYHPAMRHAAPVRRELGVATVFNFLGPLANPGRVRRQVIGVGDPGMAHKLAGVLEANGVDRAMVLFGHDGLDELSTVGPSTVIELSSSPDGGVERRTYILDPAELGLAPARPESLRGGDPVENAALGMAVLDGSRGPQRDLVALNAASALVIAGLAGDLASGLDAAFASIDSGAAAAALHNLVVTSNAAAADGLT